MAAVVPPAAAVVPHSGAFPFLSFHIAVVLTRSPILLVTLALAGRCCLLPSVALGQVCLGDKSPQALGTQAMLVALHSGSMAVVASLRFGLEHGCSG